ncbi:hypothetical protein CDAR_382871 [Caerostris darwini]|uniref:Uncharacterized protein n=1 Tax=Caerostris darwini TaxID=1538125 RepID=A0AAV4SFX2_9ARAC|nr:hypothetical protein CDAR_382871 [Caerostris darwini]
MKQVYKIRKLKLTPSPTFKERVSIIAFSAKHSPTGFSRLCKGQENSFTTHPFLYDNRISLRLAPSVFVHPVFHPPLFISVVNIGNHRKDYPPREVF